MQFEIDNQTLNDLAIYKNGSNKSIRNLFDKAKTLGGMEKFNQKFNTPLTDPAQIQDRLDMLGYFQSSDAGIVELIDKAIKQTS